MNEQEIEAYLNQLKALGFDDQTIEMYRQQVQQSLDFTSQMSQANDNLSQFNQLFGGAGGFDMSNLMNAAMESDIEIDPNSTLTVAQQWMVACGANLAYKNNQPLNVLEPGIDKQDCREMLSEWWDIDTREELFETISSLYQKGHREYYNYLVDMYNEKGMAEAKRHVKEDLIGKVDEKAVIETLRNIRNAKERMLSDGLLASEDTKINVLIWDYARIINLLRYGYSAGYMTEEESLEVITNMAPELQSEYDSWRSLSLAYIFARYIWNGEAEDYDDWKEGMETLLTDENSPWVKLDWNMSLN